MVHRKKFMALFAVLAVLLLGAGCSKGVSDSILEGFLDSFGDVVTYPDSDTTPPSVFLVFDHPGTGKQVTLKPGDPDMTVHIKPSDRFFVVAVAEDPDGVKDIKIWGGYVKECEAGDIAMRSGPAGLFSNFPDKAGPGDNVLTRRWLPKLINGKTATCPSRTRGTCTPFPANPAISARRSPRRGDCSAKNNFNPRGSALTADSGRFRLTVHSGINSGE